MYCLHFILVLEANNGLILTMGSMKLVYNFFLTVFYRQSSSVVFEMDKYSLAAI